jgi:hypothetical protein
MILGREPALWGTLFRTAILLISTFFFNFTIDQQGALNAVVAAVIGIIVAWQVAGEKAVPLLLGFAEAALAATVAFGVHFSVPTQAVIMGFAAALVGMFTRTQVVAPLDGAGNRVG